MLIPKAVVLILNGVLLTSNDLWCKPRPKGLILRPKGLILSP